jgi:hypothetical protein
MNIIIIITATGYWAGGTDINIGTKEGYQDWNWIL